MTTYKPATAHATATNKDPHQPATATLTPISQPLPQNRDSHQPATATLDR